MTIGQVIMFDQAQIDFGNKIFDMDTDVWKIGLVNNTVTPTAATAAPHWGGTGTTNFKTTEVSPLTGNYAADGPALTTITWADVTGTTSWKADKISIAQHANNPTDARWGIVYNSTDVNKRALAFVDLGSVIDLSAGPFEIKWNSIDGNGTIFTLTSTP